MRDKKFYIIAVILTIATILTFAYSSYPQPPRGGIRWFGRFDANKNGVIEREEYGAATADFFKRLDRNGDGVIDEAERPRKPRPDEPMPPNEPPGSVSFLRSRSMPTSAPISSATRKLRATSRSIGSPGRYGKRFAGARPNVETPCCAAWHGVTTDLVPRASKAIDRRRAALAASGATAAPRRGDRAVDSRAVRRSGKRGRRSRRPIRAVSRRAKRGVHAARGRRWR